VGIPLVISGTAREGPGVHVLEPSLLLIGGGTGEEKKKKEGKEQFSFRRSCRKKENRSALTSITTRENTGEKKSPICCFSSTGEGEKEKGEGAFDYEARPNVTPAGSPASIAGDGGGGRNIFKNCTKTKGGNSAVHYH